MKVVKNRCGKDNVAIDFNVNFEHYKFLNGLKTSNSQKSDITNDQKIQINSLDTPSKEKTSSFLGFGDDYDKKKSLINITF
jgi:hypothetical protein